MSRLWVFNYDFEFRLAGQAPQRVKGGPLALLNKSGMWLAPLCQPGDAILLPEAPSPLVSEQIAQLMGYCPQCLVYPRNPETNAPLADWAEVISALSQTWEIAYWGQPTPQPVMRRVNSKAFSYQIREQLLPLSWRIPSTWLEGANLNLQQLDQMLSDFEATYGGFVVKDPFGMSGRGMIFNPGPADYDHLLKLAKSSGGLLVEKQMTSQGEESFHFDLSSTNWVYQGRAKLFSSSQGGYAGSRVEVEGPPAWLEDLSPLLALVKDSGYQGPLGIDVLYDQEFRPKLLEVNARYTMGRLALAWQQRLGWGGILAFKRDQINQPIGFEQLPLPPGTHVVHQVEAGKCWVTRLVRAKNEVDLLWQEQAFKRMVNQ